MPTLVKVKQKFQITIPETVRKEIRLQEGDLLEATAKKNTIVLTPKAVVNRDIEEAIAEGLEDIKKGRVSPAFSSARVAARYLHRQARKLKTKA